MPFDRLRVNGGHPGITGTDAIMEAERLNQIEAQLEDLAKRAQELRGYL